MEQEKKQFFENTFVNTVIDFCQKNKGISARLKKAENPTLEYQSYEIFCSLGINLENENERLACATVCSSIARLELKKNGTMSIGEAIASCYKEGKDSDQAKIKLRRLLSCTNTYEACRILRPILRLVEEKSLKNIDYSILFTQLKYFKEETKIKWAKQFYNYSQKDKFDILENGDS